MERTQKLLEDSLLVIWNDRNADRRLEAMKAVYADDIVFYESDEGPAIIGFKAINDVIAGLQKLWPTAFKFKLTQPLKANHHVQHISWTLGIPDEAPVASGMDVAVIENDKIKSLHLFLDTNTKS